MSQIRLQKFLTEAGIASRRQGEQMILAGRVCVNGSVASQLGTKVQPGHDRVLVDGQEVRARRKLYIALHKPVGYLCSRQDGASRPLLSDLLPREWRHLYSVGRLDGDSEGLILLTNDGGFSHHIAHPRHATRKVYEVTVQGRIPATALAQMLEGVLDEGELLRAAQVRLLSTSNSRSVLSMTLTQGRNREIRRLLKALGFRVLRLVRTQIGPIKLGQLPCGKWRTLTESEIKPLLPKI